MGSHMQNFQHIVPKKNIVILGAGFAGITAALALSKKLIRFSLDRAYSIILINETPHHLFTPCLYEIASIPRSEASAVDLKSIACVPIEDIIAGTPIIFLQERATLINRFSKTVYFAGNRALDYDYLIVAVGSSMTTFDISGISEYGHQLKTFTDAIVLRNKINELATSKKELRILIAGAGPTGVELAGEWYQYLCYLHRKTFQICDTHIELIEAADTILPGFPEKTVRMVAQRLQNLAITVRTHAPIIKISDREAFLEDGSRIHYDLFVWSGGVMGAPILKTLGVALSKKNSVLVNQWLRIPDDPSVFVIGDSATVMHPKTKRPLPWNVPIAEQEGRSAARTIINMIVGKPLVPFKPYARYPYVLTVGGMFAVSDLIIVRFSGAFAWIIKQCIELRYLLAILPYQKAFLFWIRSLRYFRSNDERP